MDILTAFAIGTLSGWIAGQIMATLLQAAPKPPEQHQHYHDIDDYTDIAGEIPMMSPDWDEMTDYTIH